MSLNLLQKSLIIVHKSYGIRLLLCLFCCLMSPSAFTVWKRAAWTFIKVSLFVFYGWKTITQVWNAMRERFFIFGWIIPPHWACFSPSGKHLRTYCNIRPEAGPVDWMLMLLLIWCGALCSFTDPSLWLLHSRSPPAPPPQMIVSTRALLSVCPAVRPCRVTPSHYLFLLFVAAKSLPFVQCILLRLSCLSLLLSFSRCLFLLFFVHFLFFPWPPQWSV